MSDKRVLVTGGGGFIGRWSLQPLRERGYEVHTILSVAKFAAPEMRRHLEGVTPHHVDLFDSDAVRATVRGVHATHLLHFAWNTAPRAYWTSPDNFRWVSASLELLRSFVLAGGRRVVMAGSCAEYDWHVARVCHEFQTPLASDGGSEAAPYATCKVALQKMLSSLARQQKFSAAWGRIFFQFGPDEDTGRLVASVISNLLAGYEAKCSHGNQVRNYLYVQDVGAAFAAVLDSAIEGPVNIGSREHHSIRDLVYRIADIIGAPELIRLGAHPAPNDPPLLVPDVRRLYDSVGWRPSFGLDDGLTATIEAARIASKK